MHQQVRCGSYGGMATDPASLPEVARRLRAVMLDARLEDVQALADLSGAERSAASNWINGYNLPPVPKMVRLAEELRLTLDWIYRGVPDHLPMATGIRLTALVERLAGEAQSNAAAVPGEVRPAKRGRPRKTAKAT